MKLNFKYTVSFLIFFNNYTEVLQMTFLKCPISNNWLYETFERYILSKNMIIDALNK